MLTLKVNNFVYTTITVNIHFVRVWVCVSTATSFITTAAVENKTRIKNVIYAKFCEKNICRLLLSSSYETAKLRKWLIKFCEITYNNKVFSLNVLMWVFL